MSGAGRALHSDYMNFSKLKTTARYNLASSGVADCTLEDLGATWEDLGLHGPNSYGYAPLVERIAGRFGVDPACVVTAQGCSFANHLAMAAILSPGDEVLVEDPTYELLLSTLGYLQADVRRFQRTAKSGWAIEVEAVTAGVTPKTRLVVLTNLHNPTGAVTSDAAIGAIAQAAEEVGAVVLVDEVYRELMFRDGAARTVFRDDGAIVVTGSLTKAYGLSGLRCGWILAPVELAERMRRLNDLYAATPVHIAERLGVVALDRLDGLRRRANAMVDANRAAYQEILGGHAGLDQVMPDQGVTVFPRLLAGNGDELFERLITRYETSLAPGRFFGRPDNVRIGLGGDPVSTRAGLERVAEALDA